MLSPDLIQLMSLSGLTHERPFTLLTSLTPRFCDLVVVTNVVSRLEPADVLIWSHKRAAIYTVDLSLTGLQPQERHTSALQPTIAPVCRHLLPQNIGHSQCPPFSHRPSAPTSQHARF